MSERGLKTGGVWHWEASSSGTLCVSEPPVTGATPSAAGRAEQRVSSAGERAGSMGPSFQASGDGRSAEKLVGSSTGSSESKTLYTEGPPDLSLKSLGLDVELLSFLVLCFWAFVCKGFRHPLWRVSPEDTCQMREAVNYGQTQVAKRLFVWEAVLVKPRWEVFLVGSRRLFQNIS